MSSPFDFDSRLSSWLDEQAVPSAPDGLLAQVVERASHTRRRPAWATLERWISMETRAQLGAVPRTAIILVVLGVLLAVMSAIALGQQPSPKLLPIGVARNGLIAFDDGGDIYVVNPDGSGKKALTTGPAADTSPEWSQDGLRIAYYSQQTADGPAAIKVMDAGGSHVTTVVEGVTASPSSNRVSWSHDGRYLAYSDTSVKGGIATYRVLVVPVAGGDPVEVASPGQDPTWSPDDRQIAFQSGGPSKDLTTIPEGMSVVGADGKGQRLIDGAATDNQWAYGYPQWSLHGQMLTYGAQLPNDNMHIYVAAVDGSGIHAIDSQPPNGGWPVWSPDGTRVAYVGYSETDGGYRIAVMNPDGSDVQLLDHPALACNCVFKWSPDGTKVIAYQDGPLVNGSVTNELLLVIDVSGKVPVETITLATAISGDMSWQRVAP